MVVLKVVEAMKFKCNSKPSLRWLKSILWDFWIPLIKEFYAKVCTSLIVQFLLYIQGDLGSLFSCQDLSGDLTSFEEKKEDQTEKEHIYYLYSHFSTCPSFAPIHYHMHLIANVLILLVLSSH